MSSDTYLTSGTDINKYSTYASLLHCKSQPSQKISLSGSSLLWTNKTRGTIHNPPVPTNKKVRGGSYGCHVPFLSPLSRSETEVGRRHNSRGQGRSPPPPPPSPPTRQPHTAAAAAATTHTLHLSQSFPQSPAALPPGHTQHALIRLVNLKLP